MTTFSDMMTLLLCFFVLLYSMSSVDTEKWRNLVEAFTGNPSIFDQLTDDGDGNDYPNPNDTDVDEESITQASEWAVIGEKVRSGIGKIADQLGLGDIDVEVTETEIIINLPGDILFDTGRAVLKEEAKQVILQVMDIAVVAHMQSLKEIRFEGHTDKRPISTIQFPSNKELSAGRAISAANYVESNYPQIPQRQIGYIGYAETRPVDTADTPEAYAKNRRVAIVMIRDLQVSLDEMQTP